MKKFYLILLLILITGAISAKSHTTLHSNMTLCDSPVVNPDSLLLQYLTHRPLSATGGVPPYTYNFSPAVSSTELISLPVTNTTFTITITGANGCSSIYHAEFKPLLPGTTGACSTPFVSEYIQDTVPGPSGIGLNDAIELYNPTPNPINLSSYYLFGTTNGSLYAMPFFIALHGTIAGHKTFLIANAHADTGLTHKAGMLSDSLTFRGKDIVSLVQITLTPSVIFSFLDEIGTVSPLPTDSGWAVGSGSTKNHTLMRLISITQGDLNWNTCKSQWGIYPQGTFRYIGSYENTCYIDPTLTISLADPEVICGNPSLFGFNVMATSVPATILNQCSIEILFRGTAFAGDNPTSGIYVDPGPDFSDYGPTLNVGQLTDSTFYINFGSLNDSSLNGTWLNDTAKEIMRIAFRIQDPCGTGKVMLTDTNQPFATYAYIDSVGHPDSVKSYYDTTRYICRDSVVPAYPCHPYCCHLDSLGHCDDTCYDTCHTVPIYCTDTIWHYRHDTAYTITSYSNLTYTHIFTSRSDSVVCGTSGCAPVIDKIPPVNAGTNRKSDPPNSSILTIKGSNFGNEKGLISVSDANSGGANQAYLDSTDIISWTNTQIVVKVPSTLIAYSSMTPGSGNLIVSNTCSGSGQTALIINYNIMSEALSGEKLRYNMAMSDDTNSIVFRCDTSISNYPRINADVLQAISEWNCYTGINWKMGSDTILENSTQDGVSVIYFSPTPLPVGILMETYVYVDNSCNDMGDSMTYVHEADIVIDRAKFLAGGYSWNYNVSDTLFVGLYYYFYDVLLHELGHAHLLNHIDDTTSVMFYSFNPPYKRRNLLTGAYPGPQTLYGGFDVVNTSAANTPSCSYGKLVPSSRPCIDPTLNVSSVSENQYNLTLYPNPVSNQDLTISYELTQNSYIQFKIIDYTGREVMKLGDEHKLRGTYKEQVNFNVFASGVYLFVANINGTTQTIKFIKL